MNKINILQLQAIQAAKNNEWDLALRKNQEILSINPRDIGALNRSAIAHLQIGDSKEAKKCLETVLSIDKSNIIAKKHLHNIKTQRGTRKLNFTSEQFIEEPGVTKIIELHRLANKAVLHTLDVGQPCQLVPKNRYISVETAEGEYIGALPEDLSYRLTKLIKRGNKYECFIHSSNEKDCHLYIKEIFRSKKNEHINSFPLNRTSIAAINDVDERFLLEENIPVSIVSTDEDTEQSIDDVDSTTNEDNRD